MATKSIILAVALVTGAAFTAPAFADNDDNCKPATNGPWLPVEEARTALEAQGYQVRKIESEDGCYEVYATAKGGERVKLFLDPTTLKVLGSKDPS